MCIHDSLFNYIYEQKIKIMTTKHRIIATISYLIFCLIMINISIYENKEVYLNNVGSLLIILVFIWDVIKNRFSKIGFYGLLTFGVLHAIGSCWLYSYVPYNEWCIEYFSWDMNAYFGWERNHYDRIVHFSFGLLLFPAIVDYFKHKTQLVYKHVLLLTFLGIQTFSMIYELFEWNLSIFLSEGLADSYNGQQGDMWDAQKDMCLAMFGSLISYLYLAINYKIKHRSETN